MKKAIDHSLTYKVKSLKNLPHRLRAQRILELLQDNINSGYKTYIDVGCSNGFLTHLIKEELKLEDVKGVDHSEANLETGRKQYPDITFEYIDLNANGESLEKYELVTCFETLEHVGNPEAAVNRILSFCDRPGLCLISVPIEIGFYGIFKFLTKTLIYGYKLSELPGNVSWWRYFFHLLKGADISRYRDMREGWGTHFGFDYRIIDSLMTSKVIEFKAINYFTTRFYIITQSQVGTAFARTSPKSDKTK